MGKVIVDITMSLDGFVTGPEISTAQPMGKNGQLLHKWIFEGKTEAGMQLLNELVESSGAVIVGGRTYHTAIEDAWDNLSPFNVPAFVLCTTLPSVIK